MSKVFRPHFMQERKQWHRTYDRGRGSSAERGYGRDWQRVRDQFLTEHPLCEDCSSDKTPIIATLVHHKVEIAEDPEQRLAWDNLVALCDGCHQKRHHTSS